MPSLDNANRRILAILPPPFEWISIPAGKVTLISDENWEKNYIPENSPQTFDVPAFAIAKYIVTNAQYRKFIEAGGYTQRHWWTDVGWDAREKGDKEWDSTSRSWKPTGKAWTQPHYWTGPKWNGDILPVIGVSWYEAIAFCNWLSKATQYKIMLPTEQQWQRAVQGDDGCYEPLDKHLPRAKHFNLKNPENTNETMPVRESIRGVDMSDELYEWCLTAFETGSNDIHGTEMRVLRGGDGYFDPVGKFHLDFREGDHPNEQGGTNCGFRIALALE